MQASTDQVIPPAPPLSLSARPLIELLLVGGATPLLFALSWLLRAHFELDLLELAVGFSMFHAAYVVNDPHFSVTYALFYESARSRALGDAWPKRLCVRYWIAGFAAPLAMAAWIAYALWAPSAQALGLLMQLMFVLVGWHYVKQGFGVTIVLCGRRGVRFSLRERRALLWHCLSAWIYAWANPSTPSRAAEVKGLVYTAYARPALVEQIGLVALLASGAWLAACLWEKWRREGPLPLTTPLAALLASTWAWSIFAHADPLVRYVVPALHGLQYLYFVALLKGNEARERQGPPHFEPPVRMRLLRLALTALALGWLLFHGVPDTLDGWLVDPTSELGPTPYLAALYAFVNLHHYFMDNVLWRRDQPSVRHLYA